MTALLAPSLLTGSAPPADLAPGKHSTGATSGHGAEPAQPFATLLTAAHAALRGHGDSAAPPTGGTTSQPTIQSPTTPAPEDASNPLLAALMALLHGASEAPAAGATDGSDTDNAVSPLLDRPAEVGEAVLDAIVGRDVLDGTRATDALEAFESLMAYLVMAPRTQADPAAAPALPEDLRALIDTLGAAGTETTGDLSAFGGASAGAAVATLDAGVATLDPAAIAPAPEAPVADSAAQLEAAPVEPQPATPLAQPPDTTTPVDGTAPAREVDTSSASAPASSAASTDGGHTDTASDAGDEALARDARPAQPPQADAAATPAPAGEAAAGAAALVTARGPVEVRSASADRVRVVDAAALPSAVADSVQSAVLTGEGEVRLVLNPPDLGHLDITIASRDGALQIRVEASQAAAQELIDRSLPALQQALEARELRVDRLEVRQADTGRGSLDTSGSGQQSGARERGDEGRPDWSPVAASEPGAASVRPARSQAADGRIDVLA